MLRANRAFVRQREEKMRPFKISLEEYAKLNGRNDLLTEYAPDNPIPISQISKDSRLKVKWICAYGHEEIASPRDRVLRGHCSICGKEGKGSFAQRYPQLLKIWSKENILDPYSIPPSYTGFVLWECSKGHHWRRRLSEQIRIGSCPICTQLKNRLVEVRPELESIWNKEKNDGISFHEISAYSNIKCYWKCRYGHTFSASPAELMRRKNLCPICNSFGVLHPAVAAEWHPHKNGNKTPLDYTASSQTKAWFICSCCGSEYQSRIAARAVRKSAYCPLCRTKIKGNR